MGNFYHSYASLLFVAFSTQTLSAANCDALIADSKQNPARTLSRKLEPSFEYVKVDYARIKQIVQELKKQNLKLEIPLWDQEVYPEANKSAEELAYYFLILNSLNYAFHNVSTGARYSEGNLNGAFLVADKITKALSFGGVAPISDPAELANVSI